VGKDAEDAKRFHEARQKTPVIRFLDAAGKDLVDRKEGIEPAATLERMKLALAKAKEAGKEAEKTEERPKP
ncbi:MAG: hypothetical protein KIS92_20965, partial [Planctomycetota bacterium]|nr:hypothetical protein [Planctomycetota bacterium]